MSSGLEKLKTILADDNVVHIKDAAIRKGEWTTPYPLGFSIIDEAIKGGVREGDLIVCTGKSGEGKTSAYQVITVNFCQQGLSCLWFSYEVLIDNLYAKFKEMGIYDDSLKIFTPKNLSSGNLEWVQEKIKEAIADYGSKFIFIDHIDYLAPKKGIRSVDQKRIVLGEICRELKRIAIDLKVVIFLIAHVKKVQGRAIEMQDIAEAGDIYKIADLVFAVGRNIKVEKIGGQKVEIPAENSFFRVLKNRITGECPYFEYEYKDNMIYPLGVEVRVEEKEEEVKDEIIIEEVEEEKGQRKIIGIDD